jgi:hypothetical protein
MTDREDEVKREAMVREDAGRAASGTSGSWLAEQCRLLDVEDGFSDQASEGIYGLNRKERFD